MTEIVDKLPEHERLIPPSDSEDVEWVYNIGIYDLDRDACNVDTDYEKSCLYIKYCNGDYCDKVMEDPTLPKMYDFISGMLESKINILTIENIETRIEQDLFRIILGHDETFDEHLKRKCPAAEPDPVSDDDREDVAMLWCKYILERGPQ